MCIFGHYISHHCALSTASNITITSIAIAKSVCAKVTMQVLATEACSGASGNAGTVSNYSTDTLIRKVLKAVVECLLQQLQQELDYSHESF